MRQVTRPLLLVIATRDPRHFTEAEFSTGPRLSVEGYSFAISCLQDVLDS
jgi:hypothetical protein